MRSHDLDYSNDSSKRSDGIGYNRTASYSRKTGLNKNLLIGLGLGIPIAGFIGSGFYTLDDKEAAVVVEYNAHELRQPTDFWTNLIALKEGQLPGGTMKIVEYKDPSLLSLLGRNLYWHLPAPFGKHLKIELAQDFKSGVPLAVPQYVYMRDKEGNVTDIARDSLGEPIVYGYYFLTKDGIKFYSPSTWTKLQYDPNFKLDVIKVEVKGRFNVTDLEKYGALLKESHGYKIEWMEKLGLYGEMTNPPLAKEQLEGYLNQILSMYVLNVKLPVIMGAFAQQYPDSTDDFIVKKTFEYLMENPEMVVDPISTEQGTIPGFEDFFTSKEFVEYTGVDLEKLFGIDVLDKMVAKLYEEAF